MTDYAVRARGGPPAAWWGMLILIASEATLFAAFVATYFYLRFTSPEWPQDGLPEPKVLAPVILVACLVATSVPMRLATLAARAGRLAATRLYVLSALVVQAGYLAYSIVDYRDQLQVFGIGRNAYSSIYYTLLGADHAHVAIGLLLNLWLVLKLASGLTRYRTVAVRAITFYWHAVNVLTVLVTACLLSSRL